MTRSNRVQDRGDLLKNKNRMLKNSKRKKEEHTLLLKIPEQRSLRMMPIPTWSHQGQRMKISLERKQ